VYLGWSNYKRAAFDPTTLPSIVSKLTNQPVERFGVLYSSEAEKAQVQVRNDPGFDSSESVANEIVAAPSSAWTAAGLPSSVAITAQLVPGAAAPAAAAGLSAGAIAGIVIAAVAVAAVVAGGSVIAYRKLRTPKTKVQDSFVINVSRRPSEAMITTSSTTATPEPVLQTPAASQPIPTPTTATAPVAEAERPKGIRHTFYRWFQQ